MSETETNLRNELAGLAATRVLCTQRAEWNKITRAMNALTRKLNDVILEGEVARVNAACEANTQPRSTPKDESGKPDPVTDLNHVLEDLCLHFDLVPAEELARKLAAVSDPSLRL